MRTVLVTGGGTGIGYAIAEAFVAAGDRVVITGRRADVLAEAGHRLGASAVPFDATDPAADLPSTVDVLVNNAGGNTDFVASGEEDLGSVAARWNANWAANVLSAVLVTTAVTPRMPDGGRVITIGSIAARTGAGSYGAAKAAVEAWTADLSATLGPRGITANVVAPGLTLTTEFFRDRLTEERTATLVAATRTKRAGTPADIAAIVHFLASPGARHVTGQVIHANGGAYLGR
jgi:NAD(P)-dependent dehydrogenase (short-subunit alcohol dehydrogenase family)